MKIKDYCFKTEEFHLHDLPDLLPEDALLLDIETTGFKADYQTIYLIGCGFRRGEEITVRLFFAETPEAEAEVLCAFLDLLRDFDRLITFNGETFDLPFLEKRFSKHGLLCNIREKTSTDLFKIAKSHKKWLDLEHYNQKTLEHFFGIFREDQYDGGRLIQVYKQNAAAPDEEAQRLLLLHNMEDVKGMVSLLPITELSMLSLPDFKEMSLAVEKPQEWIFSGTLSRKSNLHLRIKREYFFLQVEEDSYRAVIRPFVGKMKYFYPDYKNYVYIADENLLLPKSLASAIDKSRIKKATRDICFAEKEGYFLPNVLHTDEREFRFACTDKDAYIEVLPGSVTPRFVSEFITASV